MIDKEERKKTRERVFNTKTEEQIEVMLLETEKELQDPNTKFYTMEESIENLWRLINEDKKVQDKTA